MKNFFKILLWSLLGLLLVFLVLTGIKFANFFDNPDLDTKTYITKVVITGLADGGQCVLTPRQENDGYVDDKTGDFSSKTVAVWDPAKLTYGENVSYTQTFDGANDEIDFAEKEQPEQGRRFPDLLVRPSAVDGEDQDDHLLQGHQYQERQQDA